MKIAVQTLLLIGVCTLGAICVFVVISTQHQTIAKLQQQSELIQLAQRDNKHLQLMSAQWFTTIDLFFGYQQSYLVTGIRTQSLQLRETTEQFNNVNIENIHDITNPLLKKFTEIMQTIDHAAILPDQSGLEWNRHLSQVDILTLQLIELLEALDKLVVEQVAMDKSLLRNAQDELKIIIIASIGLYFFVILCTWLWLNKSIVKPLEHLSIQATEENFSDESIFVLNKAPKEIISLSESLHGFTARLSNARKKVEQQKTTLEQNIKQLEETRLQLIQAEKLSSIGQLAAGIAHEINNPMSYIKSNLTTLQTYFQTFENTINLTRQLFTENHTEFIKLKTIISELETDHNDADFEFLIPDSKEILTDSIEGAVRIQGIVKDLYGFSHVNNNGYTEVDVNKLIEQALRILKNQLAASTKVVKKLGDLPIITAQGDKLSQVFLNLLINANHAVGEEGRITVATGAKNDKIWLQVKDNGCGIAEDKLAKIFDPFYTTKEVGEGTGLGLHIVQEIINQHNGRIEVKSIVDKGTLFSVVLPVEQPEESENNDEASPSAQEETTYSP